MNQNIEGWQSANIKRGNTRLQTLVRGKQTLIDLEASEREHMKDLRDMLMQQGATELEINNILLISDSRLFELSGMISSINAELGKGINGI